jgi:hypothetical protein
MSGENPRVPGKNHQPSCIKYTSSQAGFELTTLVVIDTDCTGSCKSNYHTITTTTVRMTVNKSKLNFFCI